MKTLDLNLLICEFAPMLRSLIGENIDLQLHLASSLTAIKADKGQIEQALMNLVVNARDAMPDGGMLVIETAYVILNKAGINKYTGIVPGPYLLLTVSDTGSGMDVAVQQRIFEPFFTTKALGQGTGLGLSTVFGIIKQHQGSIWVDSQPGSGTTFKIYLPLTVEEVSVSKPPYPEADLLAGTETVLLVEDESSVRQLVGDTLRAHGYHVLEAGERQAALALAAAHTDPLQLLLTDVVMPQMNGRKLYQQLAAAQSGLKVLYMSGYINNVITDDQNWVKETNFLQKPFAIHNLLQKVRAVLDETVIS